MSDEFVGTLVGKNAAGRQTVRIRLDADSGNVTAGGIGRGGDLVLTDDKGSPVIWLDAGGAEQPGEGPIAIAPELVGKELAVVVVGSDGIVVGGHGHAGTVVLRDGESRVLARLRTSEAGGDLYLYNSNGEMVIGLRAVEGDSGAGAWIGGNGRTGSITLRNMGSKDVVNLGGESGDLYLKKVDGQFTIALRADENGTAGAWIGGWNQNGQVVVRNHDTKNVVFLGGEHGLLELCEKSGKRTIQLKAETGAGRFGGPGVDGDVLVFSSQAPGNDSTDDASVWIRGGTGDVILRNADCAEEFELAPGVDADAGTVMVIDGSGLLTVSQEPYDRAVVRSRPDESPIPPSGVRRKPVL